MDEEAKKATAQIAQMIKESGIGELLAQITLKKAFIPGITGNMDKSIWEGGYSTHRIGQTCWPIGEGQEAKEWAKGRKGQ